MVSDRLSFFWSLHMKSKLLLDGGDGAVAPWAAGGIGGQELSSWSGGWAENFDQDSINNPRTWSTAMKAQRCSGIRLTISNMWSAFWQMKGDLSTSRYENGKRQILSRKMKQQIWSLRTCPISEYHRLSQTSGFTVRVLDLNGLNLLLFSSPISSMMLGPKAGDPLTILTTYFLHIGPLLWLWLDGPNTSIC